MNLKQNFINSLKTLLLNDPECELIENYETENCNSKEDRLNCDEYCLQCSFNEKVIVDLALIGCVDGTEIYYCFRGTKNNTAHCTDISTYKKMHKELYFLNAHLIGQQQKEDIKYYEKIEDLRQYSNEFFKELINKCFPLLHSEILPIRFHMFALNIEDYSKEKQTGGRFSREGKQSVIDIYHASNMDMESLKLNCRHEIIHYALDMSNCSCADCSGVFHALCKIYDAGAYSPMDEYEQKIYNLFFAFQEMENHELRYIVKSLGGLDESIIKDRNKLIDEMDTYDKTLNAIEVERERRRLKEVV
ncbi:hypothetical protein [Desulfosporosinus fructosivorans]